MCCSEGGGSVVSQSLGFVPGFVCGEALGRLKEVVLLRWIGLSK